jgi:phospholipid/cholesterol/gamma-HCH transport system substrate-binding protein
MKNTEAKVGAFVLICVALLTATVYYVSNAQFSGAQVPYRTYLRNAEGMEPGTLVLFGGITVGKVTVVRPDNTDPTRIEILLDVKEGTPLNAKSLAEIGSVSLMSSPALAISTGANNAPRLQPWAVIPSQETVTLDEMQRKLGTLADSAQATLATVNKDLNDLTGDGRQLLANLNDATGTTNRKHLAGILAHSDAMVAQLSPRIDQISERVLKLTSDADIVVGKMGPTVDNANETITAIRQPAQADLAQLEKTIQETRGLISSLEILVRTNSQNTTYTIENLRMATDNLNDLTQSVKERPWSLVRIKQPKDREVPK